MATKQDPEWRTRKLGCMGSAHSSLEGREHVGTGLWDNFLEIIGIIPGFYV